MAIGKFQFKHQYIHTWYPNQICDKSNFDYQSDNQSNY